MGMSTPLSRPQNNKIIAGVCAGLAERFGISATLVRILAVASCILPGPQFIFYIGAWIIVPKRDGR